MGNVIKGQKGNRSKKDVSLHFSVVWGCPCFTVFEEGNLTHQFITSDMDFLELVVERCLASIEYLKSENARLSKV